MIKFKSDSIVIEGKIFGKQTFTLSEIKEEMLKAKIKEDDLVLVELALTDRPLDNGFFVLKTQEIDFIHDLAKQSVRFVFNSLEGFTFNVTKDEISIFNFLKLNVKGYDSLYVLSFVREYFQFANPNSTIEELYLINSKLLDTINYLKNFQTI